MQFSQQRLFGYDSRLFQSETLEAIFVRGEEPQGVINDSVTLSGLADLAETLLITQEWYNNTNFPILDIKELARTQDGGTQSVNTLYNEPHNSRLNFSRKLRLKAHVTFGDPDIKHGKKGTETEQPITAYFGLQNLHDEDYFPDIGDHFVFLGRVYEVSRVFHKPEDLFQNSGVPLHVAAVATIFQYGDRKPPMKQNALPGASSPG